MVMRDGGGDQCGLPKQHPAHGGLAPSVQAMLDDTGPTAPLVEFLEAYAKDDNLWWALAPGHHQNLFGDACERLEQALVKLEEIRLILATEPVGWRDLRDPIQAVLDGKGGVGE